MKKIPLTKGKYALVDDGDFEWLNEHKWCVSHGYAVRRLSKAEGFRVVFMHRVIANTPENMKTDHINGDTLDNKRTNLRVCTQAQNVANRRKQPGTTSTYKGVSWQKYAKKWQAHISEKNRSKYLGLYADEAGAAKAYNVAAQELFGVFAKLNDIL